ncbi:hypothetical protein ACFYOK_36000 [Microbispora bryophytorum]|uniref:hypothetical protein n=1 Tax=Microbispora bryophytorum TaxID=1460882 RepID=UPI0033DBE3C4
MPADPDDVLHGDLRRFATEYSLIGEWHSATGMHLILAPARDHHGENSVVLAFTLYSDDKRHATNVLLPMLPTYATFLCDLLDSIDRDHAADELDALVSALRNATATVVERTLLG